MTRCAKTAGTLCATAEAALRHRQIPLNDLQVSHLLAARDALTPPPNSTAGIHLDRIRSGQHSTGHVRRISPKPAWLPTPKIKSHGSDLLQWGGTSCVAASYGVGRGLGLVCNSFAHSPQNVPRHMLDRR